MIVDVGELTPELALIFRLTHVDNLPWILTNGLHCRTSEVQDPSFVEIGNRDLIERRPERQVPFAPYGTLADYVPFYFTPCTPMLNNIRTGWNNVVRRPPSELVFLVASVRSLARHGVPFVFTDRHAFLNIATFSASLNDLDGLGWGYWQQRDFRRDPDDPEKFERYQAETLVHHHLPVERIDAIVCSGEAEQERVTQRVQDHGQDFDVFCRRHWFL